jgi:toxin-antitoxin system PIN domain toxin
MIAVDTNLLVHAHRRDASLHVEAMDCLRFLAEAPAPWAICYHSLIEFYGVVSQPRIWNEPSSPAAIADQIAAWRESPSLRILTDTPDDLPPLMQLAATAKVKGPMIHDARIANCCLVNGIRELWTVDRDFSRFKGLKSRNPLAA